LKRDIRALDAGGSAANDDEMKQAINLLGGLSGQVRRFEAIQNSILQLGGILRLSPAKKKKQKQKPKFPRLAFMYFFRHPREREKKTALPLS
jgi:hypothetical protein